MVVVLLVSSLVILTFPGVSVRALQSHAPILIASDSDFTTANGVTPGGSGTIASPFVIESWEITADTSAAIHLTGTTKYFVIRSVFLHPLHVTPGSSGILIENTINGRVENSRIANFTNGISLSQASQDVVTGNSISNNVYAISVTGYDNFISNNHLYNNTRYGISITGSSSSQYSGNIVTNNGDSTDAAGFLVSTSTNDVFENNTISAYALYPNSTRYPYIYGFHNIFATQDTFKNNNISRTRFALIFTESNQNLALNNTITANDFGIGLENTGLYPETNNNITMNRIRNNGFGIYILNSTSNTIYNNYLSNPNNIQDNACLIRGISNLCVAAANNAWSITKTLRTNILGGPFQGGNYYSDYPGTDADADGFGDSPHVVPGGNQTIYSQDNLPLVQAQPSVVHHIEAKSVTAQPTLARAGATISTASIVFNDGSVPESFKVTLYYNQTRVATNSVVNLPPLTSTSVSQAWNTAGLSTGLYLLTANVSTVPGEVYTASHVSPPMSVSLTFNLPPVASFKANPTSTFVGRQVTFDASLSLDPDGTIAMYAWNFGDGSSGSGQTVSHSYSTAGTFTIRLDVTDNEGAVTSTSRQVTITPDVPGTPGNLVISATSTSASLTWSPPKNTGGSPITNYKIYRATSSSSLQLLTTTGNVTSYTDTTITPGQIFYYQVTAVASDGRESSASTTQDVLVPVNTSNQPMSPELWYVIIAGIAVAGLVIGIVAIRRRRRYSIRRGVST